MAEEWTRVPDDRETDFVSWANTAPGSEFVGIWRGFETGKYDNQLALIAMGDKTKRLPSSASLARQLQRVRLGADVRILFIGQQPLKNGKHFNALEVSVRNAADILPAPPANGGGMATASDDDEVPF